MQTTTNKVRAARIRGGASTRTEVERYLPANYGTVVVESYPQVDTIDEERAVVYDGGRRVLLLIVGVDVAGWTLDDYVIPRLASGGIYAEEELDA